MNETQKKVGLLNVMLRLVLFLAIVGSPMLGGGLIGKWFFESPKAPGVGFMIGVLMFMATLAVMAIVRRCRETTQQGTTT